MFVEQVQKNSCRVLGDICVSLSEKELLEWNARWVPWATLPPNKCNIVLRKEAKITTCIYFFLQTTPSRITLILWIPYV